MSDVQIMMVPKDLYYHEVAYVRGLEKKNAELVAALKEARPFVALYARSLDHLFAKLGPQDVCGRIDAALKAAGEK